MNPSSKKLSMSASLPTLRVAAAAEDTRKKSFRRSPRNAQRSNISPRPSASSSSAGEHSEGHYKIFNEQELESFHELAEASIVIPGVSAAQCLSLMQHDASFWSVTGPHFQWSVCLVEHISDSRMRYLLVCKNSRGISHLKLRLFCEQWVQGDLLHVHSWDARRKCDLVVTFKVTQGDAGVQVTLQGRCSFARGRQVARKPHRAVLRRLAHMLGSRVELQEAEDDEEPQELLEAEALDLEEVRRDVQANIQTKDRKYRLRTYAQVMVGEEVIDYLVDRWPISRKTAVQLMNLLHAEGRVRHVHDEHRFEDARLFYRWSVPSERTLSLVRRITNKGKSSGKPFVPPRPLPDRDSSPLASIALLASLALVYWRSWSALALCCLLAACHLVSVSRGQRLQRDAMLRSLPPNLVTQDPPEQQQQQQQQRGAIEPERDVALLLKRHAAQIQEMREELQGEELQDDLWLLKYLLSFGGSREASRACRRGLAWRRDNHRVIKWCDDNQEPPAAALVRRYVVCGLHATPLLDGSPLLVTRAGLSDLSGLMGGVEHSAVMEWLMWLDEVAARWCDEVTRRTGRLTKLVRVNDLHGASVLQDRSFFRLLGQSSKTASYIWPQLVEKNVILNAPPLISVALRVASTFMSKSTMSKVALCAGDTLTGDAWSRCPFARGRFRADQLPSFMGGSCECPALHGCIQGVSNDARSRADIL